MAARCAATSDLAITFLSEINIIAVPYQIRCLPIINLFSLDLAGMKLSTIISFRAMHSLSNPRHLFLVYEKIFVSVR